MKRLLYLAALFIPVNSSFANTINTTSMSQGQVTNQAVQVVPSRQFQYAIQNTSCQGATLNISPFLSTTYGFGSPYQPYYDRPKYSTKDILGDFDDNGNAIGDGDPDEPDLILRTEQVRTGMQASNTSLNGGITATWSIPLDRAAVRLCKKGMAKQVELYEQQLASNRLTYEMQRLATCGKHLKEGLVFVGEMSKICGDVRLVTPPNVKHTHTISLTGEDPVSVDKD